jgi:anti-anti-sigma factor
MQQIDVKKSQQFSSDLTEIVNNCGEMIILNLQNISFMDSSGLGAIVSVLRKLNGLKRKMVLCEAAPAVDVLFKMVRLSQIAEIYETKEIAITNLKG